jgi:2-keto-3-deoxy-6-phosphogluconate aldolase
MNSAADLIGALHRVPVVGILRGAPPEHAVTVGTAAVGAGIAVIEVTFDSPEPAESIMRLAAAAPTAVVGAGTVRTPADVERAVAAGAAFIVTPMLSLPVVEAAVAAGVPCIHFYVMNDASPAVDIVRDLV